MSKHMVAMKKEEFDKVFEIMEKAFPLSERRNYANQKALLGHPRYKISVYKQEEDILGFMATWEFETFHFVEHFAVDSKARGLGIGSLMIKEFLEETSKEVFLEVELPETDYAKRRIGFYERIGFHFNAYKYLQPPLQEGQAFLPLRVMSYPAAIGQKALDEFRKAVYKEVYGIDDLSKIIE